MPHEINLQFFPSKYHICGICGAMIMTDPEVVRATGDHKKLHREWHESIDKRINAAAEVGSYADAMTRPIG